MMHPSDESTYVPTAAAPTTNHAIVICHTRAVTREIQHTLQQEHHFRIRTTSSESSLADLIFCQQKRHVPTIAFRFLQTKDLVRLTLRDIDQIKKFVMTFQYAYVMVQYNHMSMDESWHHAGYRLQQEILVHIPRTNVVHVISDHHACQIMVHIREHLHYRVMDEKIRFNEEVWPYHHPYLH